MNTKPEEFWMPRPKRPDRLRLYKRHRDLALMEYQDVKKLAERNGLKLEQITKFQFNLSDAAGTWTIHILPAWRRFFGAQNCKVEPPRLGLKGNEWNLIEAVNAAISQICSDTAIT